MGYLDLSKQELEKEYGNLVKRFEEIKGMGLNLNMARGKPGKEQLDLSLPMLDTINSKSDFIGEDKMDCRNYGLLNGITECRKLFADILGVARQTINKWRKIKGSPKPCSDGRHNVAKWRDFVRKHDLKEPDSPEDEELKTRKLLAEVKQAEIKLKVMEGTYVAIEKVREVWTAHIGQVRQILESRFLNELPPILTTLDAVQIREKLQEVLDETYKAISIAADSIKEPVDIED